jgi:hypothetical protein
LNLKNYTSTVPVEKTVARIEEMLGKFGAHSIAKEYMGGSVEAISFRLIAAGRYVDIRLPTNHEACFQALWKHVVRAKHGTRERIRDQARRTSWKLMEDWVHVQLSLIRMNQAEMLQVFMPYVWDGKQTFFQVVKANNFLALPSPSKEKTS